MTDYLELLLEQTEDEWDEQPIEWKRTARLPRVAKEDGMEPAGQHGIGRVVAEKLLQANRRAGEEAVATSEEAKRDVLEQLNRLERTVARTKNEGTAPRGRGQDAGVNAALPGRFGAEAEAAPASAVRLASALDMAFERDARRYDGPLGLL